MPRPIGTVPRRRLGRELKKLRDQAGMTLQSASAELDCSISTLSRIETAHQTVNVHWVKSMLDLYDAPERWTELIELTRLAKKPGWWRAYGLGDRGYVPLEAAAVTVREYTLTLIPGLLQTADYARAVLRSGVVPLTDEQLERDVEVRLHRQRRLYTEDDPLQLTVVIDESVLHRPIGGRSVFHAQLDYLLIAAELDTVTLQVLPADVADRPGWDGTFTLLGFPELDEPDLAYVEYITGAAHIEDPKDLTRCRLAFDRLRSAALSPADSMALLERLVAAP
jgi:transcriptional regulator with XRE-family HTH domain